MKKIILFLFLLILIVLAWFGFNAYQKVFDPFQGYYGRAVVQIDSGMTVAAIAGKLQRQGVISRASYFRRYYRMFFAKKKLKAGEYLFDGPLTMRQVIEKLYQGKAILYKVTVKEGLWIGETARIFEEAGLFPAVEFARAARNSKLIRDLDPAAADLEGYLFPDTYLVRRDFTAREMVALMVDHFRRKFTNRFVWRARDIGFTPRQAVILASLIEKETANRDERFLISSVFHNRLKQNMLLDCDSTIVYALKKTGRYRGKLGWDDLKFASPFNTRLHRGLPPAAIANPGYASLEAALYPENSEYLFFVAKDAGSHYFSRSLAEHNRAVRKYIINRKDDVLD
ncbi:MAG: endolytic transglycosylase MltG [Acidobacteria bacterium]|nr:endolytic transglycosylase MltG [Acidobacteriota bacterium]MBU4307503.1 endolytic transglycosylase MltG [Acidobacteriota bacterium]MCG2810886.1 endolytic transglycosylase MltG [Candidatus Aminicenantes bacterium]